MKKKWGDNVLYEKNSLLDLFSKLKVHTTNYFYHNKNNQLHFRHNKFYKNHLIQLNVLK